tara:strand:+ start:456 stop:722 length:267 start_codon:yes stop_codon:yes gene_type:complete
MTYEEATTYLRANWNELPETLQGDYAYYAKLKETLRDWAALINSDVSEKHKKRARDWVVITVKDLQNCPKGWNAARPTPDDLQNNYHS